jgi:hypothetical protein
VRERAPGRQRARPAHLNLRPDIISGWRRGGRGLLPRG